MVVTGFDIATNTGCCDGVLGCTKPRLWSWYLSDQGERRPQRLLGLRRFLVKYFETQPCDLAVYEAPMSLGAMAQMGASEETVALLRGAIGVLELTCEEAKVPIEAVPVQDARASVLGWRTNRKGTTGVVRLRNGKTRPETTKERVTREVLALGVDVENDNEADAYVVWRWACNTKRPSLAVEQTPLFSGVVK